MSENNASSDSSPTKDTEIGSVKNKKNTRIQTKNISPVITGIFWIAVGTMMLLENFFSHTSISLIKFIQYWGMLLAGLYLLVFSLLGYMRKVYFIIAACAIALWLGHVIEVSGRFNVKITWPIIMIVTSIAIILYGFFFKKHKLKNYVVTGCMFLLFSLLVLISVLFSFDLSQFLEKSWPVFLIFLGVSYVYNKKGNSKIDTKQPSDHEEKK